MTSLVSHAPAINMASHLSPSTRMTSSYVAFNLAASWRACIRPGERRPQRLPPRLQQEVISDVDSDVIAACFRRVRHDFFVLLAELRIQLQYEYSSTRGIRTNINIHKQVEEYACAEVRSSGKTTAALPGSSWTGPNPRVAVCRPCPPRRRCS